MIKTVIDQFEKKIPKPKVHYQQHQQHYQSNLANEPKANITLEVARRNGVVKTLCETFLKNFAVGEKVKLFGNSDMTGDTYIVSVCKQYTDLGKNEPWPANNNPLIVTLYNDDLNQTFHCTIGAVEKV